MIFSKFYKENKELIDKNLVPILNTVDSPNLIGCRPAIMYKKWAWELVKALEDAGWPITLRTLEFNEEEQEYYYEDNWSRIYYSFILLGNILRKKQILQETNL